MKKLYMNWNLDLKKKDDCRVLYVISEVISFNFLDLYFILRLKTNRLVFIKTQENNINNDFHHFKNTIKGIKYPFCSNDIIFCIHNYKHKIKPKSYYNFIKK